MGYRYIIIPPRFLSFTFHSTSPMNPTAMYGPQTQAMVHPGKISIEFEKQVGCCTSSLEMPFSPAPHWLNQEELDKFTSHVNRMIQAERDVRWCCSAMCFPWTKMENRMKKICALYTKTYRTVGRAYFYKQAEPRIRRIGHGKHRTGVDPVYRIEIAPAATAHRTDSLSSGWKVRRSPTGKTYYFNKKTMEYRLEAENVAPTMRF